MSKIKNGGLDQYGAEPFEQQQFGTAGVEGVNSVLKKCMLTSDIVNPCCSYSHVNVCAKPLLDLCNWLQEVVKPKPILFL